MDQGAGRDFFISYTGVNESWARWIAVELEKAGHTTVVQAVDFRPGADFVHEMQRATASARRTIAVLSPAYFGSRFAESEWRVAFAKDPTGEQGLLLPVKVQPCEPPGLLATRVFVDLLDVDEAEARRRLLAAVAPARPRPTHEPFPGVLRFPGAGPVVSNLGPRNRTFTGRDAALTKLHERLHASGRPVAVLPVEAVYGLGGVGKTALVREFAHRFASDYELIWWISADQPTTAAADLARLAGRLGIATDADQAAAITELFDRLRGRRRWLLVYDNAERPEDLAGLLPGGGDGHVLVTSRWSAWSAEADPLPLDVLDRDESVRYLQHRTGSTDTARLDELAELVGDLPLALAEAAGYVEATRVGLGEYLDLLRERARELFGLTGLDPAGQATAETDRRRIATVWAVSLDQIRARAPAAEALMTLFAFLAPVIPRTLPTEHSDVLPAPLAEAVTDPLAYNAALRALGEFSMVTLEPDTVVVHRLVQAVVRARLESGEEQEWAARAIALVDAGFPADGSADDRWPECERLVPHLLAVVEHGKRLEVSGAERGRLLDRLSIYQRERGEYRQALSLAFRAWQGLSALRAAVGADQSDFAQQHHELRQILDALRDSPGTRRLRTRPPDQ